MSDLYWLTDEQMAKRAPFFPKSHGKPRGHDKRVLSGIIFINRNGLRWRDTSGEYGSRKTPVKYDKCRYKRRNRMEIMFGRLRDWGRVATRPDRCPKVFISAIALAATVICWL
ncbi:transposase [uncultured Ruegeria sp.]|uniref:transposase n=1 Tax=uncultured Ruegeria sp. TaxID=259304 RepID=UPI00262853A5|nr:transposase [uncultured Ruegeria sp.]